MVNRLTAPQTLAKICTRDGFDLSGESLCTMILLVRELVGGDYGSLRDLLDIFFLKGAQAHEYAPASPYNKSCYNKHEIDSTLKALFLQCQDSEDAYMHRTHVLVTAEIELAGISGRANKGKDTLPEFDADEKNWDTFRETTNQTVASCIGIVQILVCCLGIKSECNEDVENYSEESGKELAMRLVDIKARFKSIVAGLEPIIAHDIIRGANRDKQIQQSHLLIRLRECIIELEKL